MGSCSGKVWVGVFQQTAVAVKEAKETFTLFSSLEKLKRMLPGGYTRCIILEVRPVSPLQFGPH